MNKYRLKSINLFSYFYFVLLLLLLIYTSPRRPIYEVNKLCVKYSPLSWLRRVRNVYRIETHGGRP